MGDPCGYQKNTWKRGGQRTKPTIHSSGAGTPGEQALCPPILTSLSPGAGRVCLQDNSARQCQGGLLLGSAHVGMCCCCGCCPLLAHLERESLGERVSIGRSRRKPGHSETGLSMEQFCQRG